MSFNFPGDESEGGWGGRVHQTGVWPSKVKNRNAARPTVRGHKEKGRKEKRGGTDQGEGVEEESTRVKSSDKLNHKEEKKEREKGPKKRTDKASSKEKGKKKDDERWDKPKGGGGSIGNDSELARGKKKRNEQVPL